MRGKHGDRWDTWVHELYPVVRILIVVLFVGCLMGRALAQSQPSNNLVSGLGDVCAVYPHSSIPLTFSAATALTQQIALSAGKAIYVCGYTFVTAATSTIQFEYGTGTNCATNPTVLSGQYIASSTIALPATSTLMVTPVGVELCAVTTGATGAANGWLSYVQF